MEEQAPIFDKSAMFTALVESNDTAVLCKSLDGRIVAWNRGAEKLFGYASEDAVGKNIRMIVPSDLYPQEDDILARVANGESVEISKTTRLRSDGRSVDVALSISPIRDAQGKIIGATKIARDLAVLRRAERRFEQIVDSAPYAIVMTGRDGKIALTNRQTELVFGYSGGELLGSQVEMLIPEELRDRHAELRSAFFTVPSERAMGFGRDLNARRKNGTLFPVEVGLTPVETEDGLMTVVTIVDISIRKEAERQTKRFSEMLEEQVRIRTEELNTANYELEQFAYVASHDLRAPLRVIDNSSRWLEEDLAEHLTDDMRDSMRLMRSRIDRMDKFLDDLLEYSRIVSRKNITNEVVTGKELIDDVLSMAAPPAGFTVKATATLEKIELNRMPLQQIFLNLVGNALKHHDRNSGKITIDVEESDGRLLFTVEDDGPGIPEKFASQIFDMFYTLRPRDQIEGSGMGLAIVRKHIKQAGGDIWLEQQTGRGARFKFTWPLNQSAREHEDGIEH